MKSGRITFLLLAIIFMTAVGLLIPKQAQKPQTQTEYLRIHIRADSNDVSAQQVKYKVKDKVVEFLTPVISEIKTKEQAKEKLNENLTKIKAVVDKTLKDNGFNYQGSVKILSEHFPLRTYGEFTLEEGVYDALIIELGSGSGDNWWCVVYPPLCFVSEGTGYTYKSKILQIIQDFRERFR